MSQSLDRALRILEILAERPRRIGEVADLLDVHPSTGLRLLQTLYKRGFVSREPDHSYRLGSTMFRLANSALENIDLRDVAKPHMQALHERCGETVHLALLQDDRVVYVEKVDAAHPVRMYSQIGANAPLHCTGVAKAVLLGLSDDRRRGLISTENLQRYTGSTLSSRTDLFDELSAAAALGYVRDREEHEVGIHCIAAPIYQANGQAQGAISVAAPTSRLSEGELISLVPDLLKAARGISYDLGWLGKL